MFFAPHLDPLHLFIRIPRDVKNLAFFISDGSFDARWSMLMWEPKEFVTGSSREEIKIKMNAHIQERKKTGETGLPFQGGLIGSIDYEFGYPLLDLPLPTHQEPLVSFAVYDRALLYDHHTSTWHAVGDHHDEPWLAWGKNAPVLSPQALQLSPTWDKAQYLKAFSIIKDNIKKGEIYQACLTFPFTGSAAADARSLFFQLVEKGAAPMGVYLEQPHRTILSLSPERFILFDRGIIETKPIKGTRPRGKSEEAQMLQELDLLGSKKETAELSMITDLLRNDLAKVSKPGSVKVMEHQALQVLPKVIHTYSHIRSEALPECSAWDIVEATFPGGSISGCPKRKAVELLKSVETSPRGIYTGCIGYISDHGRMDLNIAIRTLEQRGDTVTAGFGGGIVADSDGEQEYEECFAKAATFHSPSL